MRVYVIVGIYLYIMSVLLARCRARRYGDFVRLNRNVARWDRRSFVIDHVRIIRLSTASLLREVSLDGTNQNHC